VAKKQLGQNFLLDLNLTAKIARSAGDLTGCDVLEVGPGPGGLTRGLLAEGARRVLAVEKDARCLPALAEIAARIRGGWRWCRAMRWRWTCAGASDRRRSRSWRTCPIMSARNF
jgi:predicted RNA methylase